MRLDPVERIAFKDTLSHFVPRQEPKERKCLGCGKIFMSQHYGHRKCFDCNNPRRSSAYDDSEN